MDGIDELKEKIKSVVDEVNPKAVEIADHLFDNPELSQKEHESKRYLADILKENGFKVEEGVGGLETSFRAEFDTKKTGPAASSGSVSAKWATSSVRHRSTSCIRTRSTCRTASSM